MFKINKKSKSLGTPELTHVVKQQMYQSQPTVVRCNDGGSGDCNSKTSNNNVQMNKYELMHLKVKQKY